MPQVIRVNKARKAQPPCGRCQCELPAGSSYLYWEFRFGGKRVRCTKPECAPRRSELTQSEFYARVWDLQEQEREASTAEDLKKLIDNLTSDLEEIRDEQQEKLDNMPEDLQQGSTGELLQERIDMIESALTELENVTLPEENDEGDALKEKIGDALQQIDEALGGIG